MATATALQESHALQLYEQDKDATSALTKCLEIWAHKAEEGTSEGGGTTDANGGSTGATAISRRHNEGILTHLSSLKGRRRRRPGGRKNDVKESDGDDAEREGNLVGMLSSVMNDLSADAPYDDTENPSSKFHMTEWEFNRLVVTYNLALVHYSSGNINQALSVLSPDFWKMMALNLDQKDEEGGNDNDGSIARFMILAVRMAFLVLDCIIGRHDGDGRGVVPLTIPEAEGKVVTVTPDEILTWVEKNALGSLDNGDGNSADTKDTTTLSKDELKFRLHLYRSKLLFLGNSSIPTAPASKKAMNSDIGTRTRLSRKDLKSAMDLYQNKMCVDEKQDVVDVGSYIEKTKQPAEKQLVGSTKGGGSKLTKSRGSNQSDVSSVTSMAGGSLVTSTSDALWNQSSALAVANVEGKGGPLVASATFEGMPNKAAGSAQPHVVKEQDAVKVKKDKPDLHVQHEAVLYLKANLECLRGNTTKSLKLCSEARLAGRRSRGEHTDDKDDESGKARLSVSDFSKEEQKHSSLLTLETQMASSYDEAIYYNNLALVHQSAGKAHVALYYYSHALACIENVSKLDIESGNSSFFWSDGIARPNITAEILNNTSACAFQAGDFKRAYDCMAKCMDMSPQLFGQRPRCWLRMAQSCMGECVSLGHSSWPVDTNGSIDQLLLCLLNCDIGVYANMQSGQTTSQAYCSGKKKDATSESDSNLGSEGDSWINPLAKAATCLHKTIYLCNALSTSSNIDLECHENALLSLAYTKMEMNDYGGALDACKVMLGDDKPDSTTPISRKHATCRLYAAESLCVLGDAQAARTTLFGSDNIDDTKLRTEANSSESPLKWLVQGFSINIRKKSKDTESNADSHTSQVKRLFENRVELYQLLTNGDTEGAAAILRCGNIDPY